MARDKLTIEVGGDHPFWDVFPSDKDYRKAGVRRDDMSSISVCVDDDGSVSFNNGYAPGSDEHRKETELFQVTEARVVAELVDEIGHRFADEPRYAAFLEKHQSAAGPRR